MDLSSDRILNDDLKDRRGYSHLKEEALVLTCGRIVLEEAVDLSSDRILNERIYIKARWISV